MIVALLIHVAIAISSVAFTTYLFIRPSLRKFFVNYGLIGATLVSGTYLVLGTHANLLHSCITGLIYVTGVTGGSLVARYRFAHSIN